ncbi:beta strand repeat-containing protein [Tundrisphaera sp. TA3]|uniref:beta strand repeat-containing protein n=1 Tax=Tundrisphaera sp. TA3 TaxID=3435775 RepID=UPI003EBB9C4E
MKRRRGSAGLFARRHSRPGPRRLSLEQCEDRLLMAVFTVSNTNDSGPFSLRQAILDANASTGSQIDRIVFDLTSSQTITPASQLPNIDRANLIVDGTIPNDATPDPNDTTRVEISGALLTGGNGLNVTATGATISNLAINRFRGSGIALLGTGNTIIGCYIGTGRDGVAALGNGANGIQVVGINNLIGLADDTANNRVNRNVITGNQLAQVSIGATANNTTLRNNFIGINAAGTAALPPAANTPVGVDVASQSNRIGTGLAGEANVISGNSTGINIAATTANNNTVSGNYIGTNAAGLAAIPNAQYGIYVTGPTGTLIGGINDPEGNLISGNTLAGIFVQGATTTTTQIYNNSIGIKSDGTALGNGSAAGFGGIRLLNTAPSVFIGNFLGAAEQVLPSPTDPGNIIAFNLGAGVVVDGGTTSTSPGSLILSNSIYSNVARASGDAVYNGRGIVLTNNGNAGITAPLLAVAEASSTVTHVAGTFQGAVNTPYLIQFFTNTSAARSGLDGTTPLGQLFIDAQSGNTPTLTIPFDFVTPLLANLGDSITATVTRIGATPGTSQFSQSLVVAEALNPDLEVTTTATPQVPLIGQDYTYTIRIRNLGVSTSTNIQLFETLPSNVTPVSYQIGNAAPQTLGAVTNITLSIPNIGPGLFTDVQIVVRPRTSGVQLTNTASAYGRAFINGIFARQYEPNFLNNVSTLTSPTIGLSSDLQIFLTPVPEELAIGEDVIFAVTVLNAGPSIAADARFTIDLPASIINVTADAPFTRSGNTLTFDLGNFPSANFSRTVSIRGTAGEVGTFTSQATVFDGTGQADPDPSNNTTPPASITVLEAADLSVTLAASPAPALIGSPLEFKILVANAGPFSATAAVLNFAAPAGMVFDSGSLSVGGIGTISADGSTVTFNELADGGQVTVTLRFIPTVAGMFTATATIANTAQIDRTPEDLTASTAVSVSPSALSVSIISPTGPIALNAPTSYTFRVFNTGVGAAQDVTLNDNLGQIASFAGVVVPDGASYTISGNSLTVSLGTLQPGEQRDVTITVLPARSGVLTNSVAVATNGYEPDRSDNVASSSTVVAPADLAITSTVSSAPVLVGDPSTYTVIVANNGPATATNVVVTDILPANARLLGVFVSQGTVGGVGVLTFNPGDLAPGASAILTLIVAPTSVGPIVNSASVTSDNFDPDPANNSATSSFPGFNQPGTLGLTATVGSVNENAGSITFTVNRVLGTQGTVTVQYATSDLTARAGVNYVATSGTLTFLEGEQSKTITIPVLNDGIIGENLDFALTLSNPGGDASLGNASAVVTVVNTDRDSVAPQVSSIVPIQTKQGITGFVITFNEAMDRARAELLTNYAVSISGRDPGRGAGNAVSITGATYDPATRTVTLTTADTLPANRFYQLNLNGSVGLPLVDLSGNPLDGTGTGVAGQNYLTTIGQGNRLRYLDANGNLVTISLTRGGTMTITRDASGNASVINLANIVPRRSILNGSVTRTKQSTSRRVQIGVITGFRRFGDVRSNLTTAPFFASFAPVSVNGETLSNNPNQGGGNGGVPILRGPNLNRAAIVSRSVPVRPRSF